MNRAQRLVLAITLSAAVLGVSAACESRADQCRNQGGTVESEVETKVKIVNGKPKTSTYTEYECIVNGQEVDEWKG